MTRHEVSEAFRKNVFESLDAVSQERHKGSYGPAEESFNRIAILWQAYWKCKNIEINITPTDVAMMMSLFKHAREIYKPDFENVLDGANYLCFAGGFAAADRVEASYDVEEELDDEAEVLPTKSTTIKKIKRDK